MANVLHWSERWRIQFVIKRRVERSSQFYFCEETYSGPKLLCSKSGLLQMCYAGRWQRENQIPDLAVLKCSDAYECDCFSEDKITRIQEVRNCATASA